MFFSSDSDRTTKTDDAWTGYLDLAFVRRGGKTVLDRRLYSYPFSLSRMFYVDAAPVGMGSVILQTASGTLNAGDRLRQRLHSGAMSAAHVATQGATAVHRAPAGTEIVERVELVADEGSLLEYVPQPRILFPDTCFSQAATLEIGPRSVAITCEGFVVYDPSHRGRSFRAHRFETRIMNAAGRILATEAAHLDALPAMTGRRSAFTAFGTLFVATLRDSSSLDSLKEAVEQAMESLVGLYWAVSALPNGCGVSLRIAAQDGNMLRAGISAGWQSARRHLFGSIPGMLRKAA